MDDYYRRFDTAAQLVGLLQRLPLDDRVILAAWDHPAAADVEDHHGHRHWEGWAVAERERAFLVAGVRAPELVYEPVQFKVGDMCNYDHYVAQFPSLFIVPPRQNFGLLLSDAHCGCAPTAKWDFRAGRAEVFGWKLPWDIPGQVHRELLNGCVATKKQP